MMLQSAMQKRFWAVLLFAAMTLCFFATPAFAAEGGTARITLPQMEVPCRTAVLVSLDTGEILYEKEPDAEVPVASITKVMTLLLTLEAVEAGKIAMTDIVPISTHAYEMGGSQIWLEPGEQFTLDELVKAICVCSANDAAVAVAEFVGGSEPVFAEMMNARAKQALLRHPKILEYSGIWMDTLRGGATQLTNTNKLLKSYTGITGLKTGTTNNAGVCIAASAVRDDMGLLAVVLGSASGKERFLAATTLLDYGFATYEIAAFPPLDRAPAQLAVTHGIAQTAELSYAMPQKVLMRKGEGKTLRATAELPKKLAAPLTAGTEIGRVTLSLENESLATYPVIVKNAILKIDFKAALSLLTKALLTL
ncbi:MAG: D-alanyl-D-alanine carboxypeptidase family protein [Ruthenibacterium sp.]